MDFLSTSSSASTPVCLERCCCTAHLRNPTIRAYYSRAHQHSLAARTRAHLLQIGCPGVGLYRSIHGTSPTVTYSRVSADVSPTKTTAAVVWLSIIVCDVWKHCPFVSLQLASGLLPRYAIRASGLCRHAVSVAPSVSHVREFCQFTFFHHRVSKPF